MLRPPAPRPRAGRAALGRLLVAATAAVGGPPRPDLRGLVARAPQQELPALARTHRVQGCAAVALRGVPGVDPFTLAELDLGARINARRHLQTVQALARIGRLLDAADVPWLTFKGPVASSLLYGDPGLRSYADLDLLVPRARFAAAVEALESAGFEHLVRNWPAVRHFEAGELALADRTVTVDLHWHLLYAFYDRRALALDPAPMVERARTVAVGGRPAPTFDAVDTLLHLALHAARSGLHRLVWLKDLERSLAVDRPDLDELVRRARAAGGAAAVGLALERSRAVLGADVPRDLVADLLGRPWREVERLASALTPPAHPDARLARLVARATAGDAASSVRELRALVAHDVRSRLGTSRGDGRRHDLREARGGDTDKAAYLAWVSRCG